MCQNMQNAAEKHSLADVVLLCYIIKAKSMLTNIQYTCVQLSDLTCILATNVSNYSIQYILCVV